MTINRFRFYVGTVGAMQALPPLNKGSNPSSTVVMYGGMHQSLSARTTLDVFGFKRTYVLPWTYLARTDRAYINAIYRGIAPGPYRLIDGRHYNVIGADASSGGSQTAGVSSFTATAGALAFGAVTLANMHADLVGLVRGAQVWAPAASGNSLLANHLGSPVSAIPALAGSIYSFSLYASGSGNHSLLIQPYDISGALLTAYVGPAVTLTAAMQRLFVDNWTPPLGTVGLSAGVRAASTTAITTTGWQLEIDQAHSVWGVGAGCPTVIPPSVTESYPYVDRTTSTLILQEI